MRLKHDARTNPEDAGGPRGLVTVRKKGAGGKYIIIIIKKQFFIFFFFLLFKNVCAEHDVKVLPVYSFS